MSKRFEDRDLSNADFAGADLTGAEFRGCGLAGARFRGAVLRAARFVRCRLFEPDAGAGPGTGASFEYADLRDAVFERSDLSIGNLERVRGYGLTLSHCQAQGTSLANADFTLRLDGRGRGVRPLAAFSMDHCNFAYGDLSNTFLGGCTLTHNRMVEALLHNTVLDGAVLTGSDLCNVSGRGISLKGADLRGAVFNNLDPRTVDLAGVRITPAQGLTLLEALGLIVSDPG